MTCRSNLRIRAVVAAAFGLLAAGPRVAAQGPDGFLFREPNLTLTARVGYAVPALGSELFDFTTEQLTLGRSDFNGPAVGGELAVRVASPLDLTLAGGYAAVERSSEFREWVGEDDLPIEQVTRFQRSHLTAGLKFYLTERGRTAGTFAWVPRSFAPYLSVAAGRAWYVFEQSGEFVDFETLDIFAEQFRTDGGGWTGQVAAGADISAGGRWFVNAEARYGWARADLEDDFVGFDRIDLSGFQGTLGLGIRL